MILLKEFIKLNLKTDMIHDDKGLIETCRVKYKDYECCIEYTSVLENLIECKCLCYNKNHKNNLMKTQEEFANTRWYK